MKPYIILKGNIAELEQLVCDAYIKGYIINGRPFLSANGEYVQSMVLEADQNVKQAFKELNKKNK